MIKEYNDIDNFLNEIWDFRNHIFSFNGIFRVYSNPIRLLKLYKASIVFREKYDKESLEKVYNIFTKIYKVPSSINSLVDFYKNNLPPENIPQNILIAKYLTTRYNKSDFEVINELQSLYIPNKDPIYNIKNISLLSAILISLLLKNNPKILKDLGVNIERLFETELYYWILGLNIYFGILLIIVFVRNYKVKRRIEFKIHCLKSCILLNRSA